ncbi:MAG: carboxylesterase/lipase family protein [Zunongwangia sp.]|uniref:Carboxylic ester hydrolase n=1 Tax=Zunongwangia profunda (strain DSM 18752 / CCTCC AB 206139 / SM-A87) TaxID=655815 RepID=D5BJU1_ZUNPS|nr:carboxylesterase family protein [Zunongwangia profunda]ADF53789.1 carboxylesterase type B [Zunongwangia profunda SM-A87]MAB91062.1 carboxylesterase/lipase family protein [Planctomycetota bacterium]MAO34845.1 carboxylesterase/lipase family protein [Zunongwangia sp.]|tara:strand:- start:5789 stop:7450 length:1662 start_codon:yes stop_codon:yes gene_type:complete
MDRRNFFGKTGMGMAACGVGMFSPLGHIGHEKKKDKDTAMEGQQLFIGEDIAVAPTAYGKVKGFVLRGINVFRGIPYGADTSGKNRFMPPQPPEPWEDVRPAVFYGNSAPQDIYDRSPESYSAFVDHWNYDVLSEDCLRLNIWTPKLDSAKRPVLVWLHGGGFSRGNGIEQDGYDGENIAREGDIVYCSINHRLGPLGFTNLAGIDGKFKDSGNVGMLDIVAALRWVNENISAFGGDPENVTIMGQSGGGAKVCNIASMPMARGLVHKGVALSGSATHGLDVGYTEKLGQYILKEAGLENNNIEKLQNMPWKEYLNLAYKAANQLELEEGDLGLVRGGFGPIANDISIPKGEYFSANADQPDIPLLFCSTFHEWNPNRDNPELENISLEGIVEKLRDRYGDHTQEVVRAFSKNFPEARPIEIWALIVSNRQSGIEAANAKLKQESPVYLAWFGWESPLFDGRHRAFHCIDISFWLLNTDLMITHTGGGAIPRQLSQKMSKSLLSFMRTGDPNCDALPLWPRYTAKDVETMILNNKCSVSNNSDQQARAALSNS